MAISYTAEVRDIVQESFNLLRQDFAAPEVAEPAVTIDEVDDGSLEWQKARLAVKTAANEIYDSHGWSGGVTADGIGAWPSRMRNALVYCIARELAIPIAGRVEDMKVYDAFYRDKLTQAKIADLEAEKEAVEDPDIKWLAATISMDFSGMQSLPRSFAAVVKRITDISAAAREEVLLSHPWRFAEIVERVACGAIHDAIGIYRFETPYPKCLRLISVIGNDGRQCEWKVEDGYIKADRYIFAAKFVKDIVDTGRWPAMVRNAYRRRLAADVARTVMGNAQDAQMQEALYQEALRDAKLRDTTESNTPTDAWNDAKHFRFLRGNRNLLDVAARPFDDHLKVVPFGGV